jgi:AcrR family transcriptional regulator
VSESAWLLERLPAGRHGLSPDLVGENQRARLTAAAAESLAERGYGAITVTDVVKRAGVSTSTFYKRFDDLWGCLAAAYEAGAERLCEAIEGACPDAEAAIEAALALLAAEPPLAHLLSAEPPSQAAALAAARAQLVKHLAALLRSARADRDGSARVRSSFHPDSDRNLYRAAQLVAGALALVAMRIRAEGAESLPALAPTLTGILLTPP